ncbi:MAG: AAA family ATPase [Patescibacteria group bacterium]
MRLKNLEINGFKSFSKKTILEFQNPIVSIVGPNGSGKSNIVEALRFVLGEQSMKSMRGSSGSDLIFKGSKNLPKSSRATVTIYFDNSDKVFKLSNETGENINLNYDVISISREVYSDGLNKYILNGSEIRLKDINNLLSSVNIGSSGHHIISQGEADRILNASPKDRREMVEDALGLKIYQYKIKESRRKLERTTDNMKEVSLLRRENIPHLNFLKKQMDKFEKAKEMQVVLLSLYREYLKKEEIYLENEKKIILTDKEQLKQRLSYIEKGFLELGTISEEKENIIYKDMLEAERKISEFRSQKDEFSRKLGRTQAMLELKENKVKMAGKCPVCGSVITDRKKEDEEDFNETKDTEKKIQAEITGLVEKEKEFVQKIKLLKTLIDANKDKKRSGDIRRLELTMDKNKILSELNLVGIREDQLSHIENDFINEIKEGEILVGQEIISYKNFQTEMTDRNTQEEIRKKIERIKIKLEDVGLGGGFEFMKEFEEVTQRDNFLAKEMEDLVVSIESLNKLMADLKEKIDIEFKEGIKKINIEFDKFFSLMFGGGTGSLSIIEEKKKKYARHDSTESEEESEEEENEEDIILEQGIEINVSLPHKKVKELNALSGGERSLTSIALLFAMSQVNPPPFLVLDETDAALDEANSRKYGNMLEKLSYHSQLIVVTHNRETMSRAGVLYGVTIGNDGASKLLSVKLDEAAAIAK